MLRLILPVVLLLLPLQAVAAAQQYLLRKDESVVGFTWQFGKDSINGRMPVAGADVAIDFKSVANSRVAVAIDVAHARAGFIFADQALKGPKVLWADRYPAITFESVAVRRKGTGAEIDGNLTIRGVTRPITLEARLYRPKDSVEGDRSRLSILVTGKLARSAFGATGWSDLVGDEVTLKILARIEQAN